MTEASLHTYTGEKWRSYPKYKLSGVEWLGEVPDGWRVKRLKHVSQLYGRIGFRGYTTGDIVDELEGAISLSPSNMIDGRISLDKCTYISWDKYNESPEIKVEVGDSILVKTGSTLGKTALVEELSYPMTINPQLAIFKNIQCNRKFFSRYLRSSYIQHKVDLSNTGGTIPTMTQETIGNYAISIPPLQEQQNIADFLDRETGRIDALIEKKERLVELLKEKRTTLISRAVSKGLNPYAKMKDSSIEWLGEVPEHWEVKRLKFLLDEPMKYGANEVAELEDPEQPRYIRITDVNENGSLRNDTFKSLPEDIAQPYLLKEGDLLFARSGATVGKTFLYIKSWGRAAYAGYLIRARIAPAKMLPKFAAYFARTDNYWSWLRRSFIQATIQNVSAEKYACLVCPAPPLEEQTQVIEYLNTETGRIDRLIDKMTESITKLREYRTALISAAVTGKIDVRKEIA